MKQAQTPKLTWVFGAVVILGVAALAGCTLVGDNITGVNAGVGPTSCVKQCNDYYKVQYKNEQKVHDTNVEGCQLLDQPARGDCLVAEDARHQAAKTALGDAKIDCQNNCHRQGSGSAG